MRGALMYVALILVGVLVVIVANEAGRPAPVSLLVPDLGACLESHEGRVERVIKLAWTTITTLDQVVICDRWERP